MSKAPAPKPVLDILCPRNLELGPFASGETDAGPWQHWRLRTDEDNIAWLLFDKKDASANTLDEATLTELNAALEKIEQERPRGLVIRSAKPSGFIAGADIAQFRTATDPAAIETMLTKGHAVLDRLDNLPLPTVAVVHGFCLGGGLELALACDLRIAHRDAQLGLPEVRLGLLPGGGGTQRAQRLLGRGRAAWLIMSGERISAEHAERWGLVEHVVDDLDAGVEQIAGLLARQSLGALREIKQVLHATREERSDELESAAFARLVASEDGREGIAAFLEKRQPRWSE
jgi:3-hydroxyacyl-CoA dehydrogenase/enoyl-CoA hydratase/3-hydroxybutyryl-CoA epimerase